MNVSGFINKLITVAPELEILLHEHVEENGEVLPHIFMADVTRYLVNLVTRVNETNDPSSESKILSLLSCLEESLVVGDERVRNVVEVSFIENLDHADRAFPYLRTRLGKKLTQSLRTLEND